MKYHELINTTLDSVTSKRVYGEPFVSDGVTIIPAAVVSGGVGDVTRRPAYDLNRVVTAVGMTAIIYLLSRPRVARAQQARRKR